MGIRTVPTRRTPAVIEIHIEELILHGFNSSDRFRIGDAMQGALHRLIAAQSLPALFGKQAAIERLDAGQFKVAPGAGPQSIGDQLAQSVHQRIWGRAKDATRALGRKPR